jgi:hypothetical protein
LFGLLGIRRDVYEDSRNMYKQKSCNEKFNTFIFWFYSFLCVQLLENVFCLRLDCVYLICLHGIHTNEPRQEPRSDHELTILKSIKMYHYQISISWDRFPCRGCFPKQTSTKHMHKTLMDEHDPISQKWLTLQTTNKQKPLLQTIWVP